MFNMARGLSLLSLLLRIIPLHLIVLVNRTLPRNLLKFFLENTSLPLIVFLLLFQFLRRLFGPQSFLLGKDCA